jgi:hypothetical protein
MFTVPFEDAVKPFVASAIKRFLGPIFTFFVLLRLILPLLSGGARKEYVRLPVFDTRKLFGEVLKDTPTRGDGGAGGGGVAGGGVAGGGVAGGGWVAVTVVSVEPIPVSRLPASPVVSARADQSVWVPGRPESVSTRGIRSTLNVSSTTQLPSGATPMLNSPLGGVRVTLPVTVGWDTAKVVLAQPLPERPVAVGLSANTPGSEASSKR